MPIHPRSSTFVIKVLGLALVALATLILQPSAPGPASAARVPTPGPGVTSPTGSTVFQGLMGDADCSVNVNSVDALKLLRFVAHLQVTQNEPCPVINTAVQGLDFVWGDVDCSGSVGSVDALKILRFVAHLSVTQTEPCTDLGNPVTPLIGFGDINGNVVNAINNDPLPGATVRLREHPQTFSGTAPADCTGSVVNTDTTDGQGTFGFTHIAAGYYDIEVVLQDFLDSCLVNILVLGDQTTVRTVSLSPPLGQGELRIVLSWGEHPVDIDSHLWLPEDHASEIAFFSRGTLDACPFADLDVDDITSFGPETVTIAQRFNGVYRYAVHNWSGEMYGEPVPIRQSQAQVQVFGQSGLIASYSVPTSGEGFWWHVFDMDGQTGAITSVNTIGGDPRPYPEFTDNCP
ncbi:MAG TPA: hypothetical protein VLS25_00240 [Dehalococcoidia bacterium]|nr:hypothetical protein [Dehalococcoidia bacterium]